MGFYDWMGAAALEEDIVDGAPLEELTGLPRDRWIVVAFDIHSLRSGNRTEHLRLYLVDKATARALRYRRQPASRGRIRCGARQHSRALRGG